MKNIGIFGGGQLAKMIAIEGYKMGLNFNIYDKNENACSKSLADNFYNYDFLDKEKVNEFFKINDVFTYEFENIEPDFLGEHENKIPQGLNALKLLQDRYTEKNFINKLDGAKTVDFCLANEDIKISKPYIIKSRRLGYDGKGQLLVKDGDNVSESFYTDDYIVEDFLTDIKEYSIVMGRSITGEIAFYEPISNIHKKGVLYTSTFGTEVKRHLRLEMIAKTKEIITELNYYGVLCVEFFISNDKVYVNEVAPRVHNSGHLTFEASNVSQFKLHLLCILGLPLPKIECYDNFYMVNILGHDLKTVEKMQTQEEFSSCNFHIYGKNSYDTNRKVGHVTFKNNENLLSKVKDIIKGTV